MSAGGLKLHAAPWCAARLLAVLVHRHAMSRSLGIPWVEVGCCFSYTQRRSLLSALSRLEPSTSLTCLGGGMHAEGNPGRA